LNKIKLKREGKAEGRELGSVSDVHATTSTTAAFMAMNDHMVTRVSELPLDKVRTDMVS